MDKNQKLIEYFKTVKNNNKLGHAFLICNTNLKHIKNELNVLLSDYFFEENISLEDNEDIIIIEPEDNIIKKEKINTLHEYINTTSQTHNLKVYIIDQCEKMNESSSNSLLKLLEEPEENIYAILISENVQRVISTIYSRCQILNIYNQDSSDLIKNIDEETINDYSNLFELIETKKTKSIAYYSFITKKIKEKSNLRNLFNVFLFLYRDMLEYNLKKEVIYFKQKEELIENLIRYNNTDVLSKKLIITSKYLNFVENNFNANLILDRYIVELSKLGVEDE